MENSLLGQHFGRWLVVDYAEPRLMSNGRHRRRWLCRCSCGTVRAVDEPSLTNGRSKSCGCYHSDIMHEVGRDAKITHGMSYTRLYRIYKHMLNRCNNPNDIDYENYGGRGIGVDESWEKFETFVEWAYSNGYDDSLSIDRIDVNRGYSPDNCRWADATTQANNKTNSRLYTYNGETRTIGEWAAIYNIPYKRLWRRFERGWSVEKALLT